VAPDVVQFRVLAEGPRQIVVEINRTPLVDLVSAYEASCGYRPLGGYAGLIPEHFNFGELVDYFLGRDNGQWPRPGRAWLLGCDCGELGCWPLEAMVHVSDDLVVWSGFRQPHRPDRDYTGFGPYVFDREQYQQAVSAAVAMLESSS